MKTTKLEMFSILGFFIWTTLKSSNYSDQIKKKVTFNVRLFPNFYSKMLRIPTKSFKDLQYVDVIMIIFEYQWDYLQKNICWIFLT